MTKVYIPNRSGHNVEAASAFGDIVVLSKGTQPILSILTQHREFVELLKDSDPGDYIAVLGPSSLVALASCIMATKHGRVNYLIYDKGMYKERNVVYDQEDKAA